MSSPSLRHLFAPLVVVFIACGDGSQKVAQSDADTRTNEVAEPGDTAANLDQDSAEDSSEVDTGRPADTSDDSTTDTSVEADTLADANPADVPSDVLEDTFLPDTTPDTTDTAVPADTSNDISVPSDTTTPTDTLTDATVSLPGEACDNAHPLVPPSPWQSPFTVSGDTTSLRDDLSVLDTDCPSLPWPEGDGIPDEFWSFTARTAGVYDFTLKTDSIDLGLYAVETCDPRTCLGGMDTLDNPETLTLALDAGQTIFIVIDSYIESSPAVGPYTLTVAPPRPRTPGDTCSDPLIPTLEPGTLNFVGAGDTSPSTSLTDNFDGNSCGAPDFADGQLARDQIWQFRAPSPGTWRVTVTPTGDGDPLIYAFDAPCDGLVCAADAADVGFEGAPETLLLENLGLGEMVFVVVDSWGWGSEAGGPYKIRFTLECATICVSGECGMRDGCGGICGCNDGESCTNGICTDGLPGNTCEGAVTLETDGLRHKGLGDFSAPGLTDTRDTSSCPQIGGPSPTPSFGAVDQFFSFTIERSLPYTIMVTPLSDSNPGFALFKGTSCLDGTCAGFIDAAGTGQAEFLDITLNEGVTYTLMVESTNAIGGPFLVEVIPACTPRCEVGTCGQDDGCGGACGCEPGERCEANQCLPDKGDTCVYPYAIVADASGVFIGVGDLSGGDRSDEVDDDYEFRDCPNLDGVDSTGDGTPDEVFEFNIDRGGRYVVLLKNIEQTNAFFALFRGKLCESNECLGRVDNAGIGEVDKFYFDLEAGTYTLVVDTFAPEGAGPYAVIIEPSP
jgi:hypothetical protein